MRSRTSLFVLFSLFLHTVLAAPAPGTTLPRRGANDATPRLVQYAQTFTATDGSPLSILPILQQNTGVTHVILASLHINQNPGDIRLNDNPPNASMYDNLWSEVKTLQANGIKVMMLLGGAAQGSYQRLAGSDASFQSYYQPLLSILRTYSIDGLDLDIEEPVDISVPLKLLQQLNADLGASFILTMAPEATGLQPGSYSLTNFSYYTLDSQATDAARPNGKLVNWYNAQFYNGWGDDSNQAGYDSIISSGWAPDRVVVGALDNSADGGSGFTAVSTLNAAVQQLRANYATFGGLAGWEYFNAGGSDGLAQPYQWDQAVGAAMFGAQTNYAVNTTSAPLPAPQVPFPALMGTLEGLGASWQQAVRALNVTGGNLAAAEQLLFGSVPPL